MTYFSQTRRASLVALAGVLSGGALAQAYPSKPVRVISPYPPGGSVDTMARLMQDRLSSLLGQPIVVETRPGAGGNIAAEYLARSAPDGYTLLIAPTSVYAVSAAVFPKLAYDLVEDLAPISMLANVPHVLVANAKLPVKNLRELIDYAKARPNKLNFASQGNGTVSHVEGALFNQMAGTQMIHIPYNGSAPAMADLISGRVDVMFDSLVSSMPHIKAGSLRAIGLTTSARPRSAPPEIPTLSDAGLTGYAADSWIGLVAPARTPEPILRRINAEVMRALAEPELVNQLLAKNLEPEATTQQVMSQHISKELAKWKQVVREAGIRIS